MKVHVHGIGACWMGATVDHVFGSGMVDLDGGWGMFYEAGVVYGLGAWKNAATGEGRRN